MPGSEGEDTRVEPPWPVEEENERRTCKGERSRVSEDRIRTCAGGQGDVSLCITHFALVFRFSCNRDVPLHQAGWLEAVARRTWKPHPQGRWIHVVTGQCEIVDPMLSKLKDGKVCDETKPRSRLQKRSVIAVSNVEMATPWPRIGTGPSGSRPT